MLQNKPSKEDAMNAIRLLLRYIGENDEREGLKDTPERVLKSYMEIFAGYNMNPADVLKIKFYDTNQYEDFVLLRSIKFSSVCEHHMLPFTGYVDIAYIPDNCVVGISKIARLVQVFAKRLQIQEKMTSQIADSLQDFLNPLGVAIKVCASHSCMTMRGVLQENSMMDTYHYTGLFKESNYRTQFLNSIK